MEVKQIATIMNNVTGEILGKSDIVAEDLSNIVDIGTEIFNASAVDNYVKSLVNHIGKVIFVNRPYSGSVPSVLMDSWEYGSVLQKISAEIPEATENDTWNLQDGTEYKQNIFHAPKVTSKFFNSKTTFEIPMSFTERQVKESFSNAEQLNAFLSMIQGTIDKSLTIKVDSLVMRTINNMIAQTLHHDFSDVTDGVYTEKTSTRAVNLLKLYKERTGDDKITAETAIYTPAFIRFASFYMGVYKDRLSKISTLFNCGGKARFTPSDMLHIVLLSDFKNAAAAYLESDTYHDELVRLPNAETVPFWQGSGDDYGFAKISDIHVNIPTGETPVEITASGILGVMFDRDSLGICNQNRRVTTAYNAKGEFYNNFYKVDSSQFNDLNENFVVFFVA